MQVINVRNAHEALPEAVRLMSWGGVRRESRNGPVVVFPTPVTTVYEKPCERVMLWEVRDANPFFHLMESLWMLAGRNDVEFPATYAKNISAYSDDGKTFHGAYGHRWRKWFSFDQLDRVIRNLRADQDDRRQVVSIWSPMADLDTDQSTRKDLPCNLTMHFQINVSGELDMTVFNRSNDIVWGAYGANVVHFSFLLEYMAAKIGVPVGQYYQVSCNWHGYLDTLKPLLVLQHESRHPHASHPGPYELGEVEPMALVKNPDTFDMELTMLLGQPEALGFTEPFLRKVALPMMKAHQAWREGRGEERYTTALSILTNMPRNNDWRVAAEEWIERRYAKFQRAQDDGASHE